MRSRNRRILALTIGAAAAASAVPATLPATASSMEIAMQDDVTLVDNIYDRTVALGQFKLMGGTHVRILLDHKRGSALNKSGLQTERPIENLDAAVDAIVGAGMKPQISLFYRGQTKPAKWKSWARTVTSHFGNKVNRYSVGNEPDLYEVEDKNCTRGTIRKFKKRFAGQMKGNRAKVKTTNKTVSVKDACNRYQRGVTYRKIFGAAAKGIKQGNRRAQILAGETSPNSSLDWFMKAVKPKSLKRKGADGWAHHPFQFQDLTPAKKGRVWGMGQYALLKRTVKMPIYLTEFGYPKPGSEMDDRYYNGTLTDAQVAKANVAAWKLAKAKGAKQMLQYQWYTKPEFRTEFWDTSLLLDPASPSTPQYEALVKLINSW